MKHSANIAKNVQQGHLQLWQQHCRRHRHRPQHLSSERNLPSSVAARKVVTASRKTRTTFVSQKVPSTISVSVSVSLAGSGSERAALGKVVSTLSTSRCLKYCTKSILSLNYERISRLCCLRQLELFRKVFSAFPL